MTTRLTVSSLANPIPAKVNTVFAAPLAKNAIGPFYIELGATKNVVAFVNLRLIGDEAAAKTTLILPRSSTDYIFKTASGAVTISETTTNPTTQKSTTKVIASLDLTKTGVTPLVKFTDLTAKFQPTSINAHTLAASELLTIASPTFTLNDTGASTTDGITNDGALNAVSAGNTVEYSIDGGKNYTAGSTLPEGVYEAGSAKLRATSSNGGVSKVVSIDKKIVIDKTAPAVPVIKLDSDTGISETDGITKNGSITVSGIEAGAKVDYSLDGGKTFSTLTGSSFVAPEGVYAKDQIVVKQTDVAGNVSATATLGNLTVDITVAIPNIALAVDTGISPTDGITNNKLVNVTGLESGAIWQYSVNASPFENGTGTTFNLPADLVYEGGADADILVRQTDIAGNESDVDGKYGSNSNTWTLDTVKPTVPAFDKVAVDNIIDKAEKAAGITITGTTEADSTVAISLDGSATTSQATVTAGKWSYTLPADKIVEGSTIKVTAVSTDKAGNASAAVDQNVIVAVNVDANGTSDAVAGSLVYVIAAGTYEYTIANLTANDQLQFPTGGSLYVVQDSFKDGFAVLEYISSDSKVTDIKLTGLSNVQDLALAGADYKALNTLLGAEVATIGLTNAGAIAQEIPNIVNKDTVGPADASVGNVTYTIATNSSYNFQIDNFATGDKLVVPTGGSKQLIQDSVKDGYVIVEYILDNNVVDITLTGLTLTQEKALNSYADINAVFGTGTVA